MIMTDAFMSHLQSGTTTLCRAWAVTRRDGLRLGFTDHDRDLTFAGLRFAAGSGLSAQALEQGNGLAVDNSEALGLLNSEAIAEEDLRAGRYDGAEVQCWWVNWADVNLRRMLFRGTLGEVRRSGGGFRAELRGLSEALNQLQGHCYQAGCTAILGDARCGVDLDQPGYAQTLAIDSVADGKRLQFTTLSGFEDGWFERGRAQVLSGEASGLVGVIKADRALGAGEENLREIELWQDLNGRLRPGDLVRLEAGCDRREETCRLKFDNFLNFRGFPHIPGEDWLTSYPVQGRNTHGGSLQGGAG